MRLDNNLTAINIKKPTNCYIKIKKPPRGVKPTITETSARRSKRKKFLKFYLEMF